MNNLILPTPTPLDTNPAAVYIASLGTDTGRRSQAQALRVIAEIMKADVNTLNWSALRYQHTSAIRAQLAARYAPATANKILSALRQTLQKSFLMGQMSADDYQRAAKLDPVTGETVPAGRELTEDEIAALFAACRQDTNTNAGTRDAAMIGLLYTAGLRRAEIVSLTLADYDPTDGRITVTGKRSKQRTVYVTNGAQDWLASWLARRGTQPGALFMAIDEYDTIGEASHLNPQAVYKMLKRRALEAGIGKFSPHDMRRTFATHLLAAGADVLTVAKMGGWVNIQTVRRYDRRPEDEKRKAASLLKVPY